MTTAVTPAHLVALAEGFVAGADRALGTSRHLAAALLLRQALEDALRTLWETTVPGLQHCSARAQLVSLPFYLEEELAEDVVYCWHRLSHACHHDDYDLPPTAAELTNLGTIVRRLAG